MASEQKTTDLGVLDGHVEHRDQVGALHVQLESIGPYRFRDDEPVATLVQTVKYPAKHDLTVETELQRYTVRELIEDFESKLAEMGGRS